MSVTVERGDQAHRCLDDPAFRDGWAALYSTCPFSTPFLSLAFIDAFRPRVDEVLLVVERDPDGTVGGVLALSKTDEWAVFGGAAAIEDGWLARPLLGSYFMERAVAELARHLDGERVIFGPIVPNAPIDWASPARRAGRFARVDSMDGFELVLDPDSARRPIDKKVNSTQLAGLRKLGAVSLTFEPDADAIGSSMDWHDARAIAMARRPEYTLSGRRAALTSLAVEGHVFRSGLVVGDRVASVFIGHCCGERLVIEMLTEAPDLEEWAPAYVHWHALTSELVARGIRIVDVPRGPEWLTWLATGTQRRRVRLLFGPADRLRFDARARAVGLGRWALRQLDR